VDLCAIAWWFSHTVVLERLLDYDVTTCTVTSLDCAEGRLARIGREVWRWPFAPDVNLSAPAIGDNDDDDGNDDTLSLHQSVRSRSWDECP
jgi:hypothetical protein